MRDNPTTPTPPEIQLSPRLSEAAGLSTDLGPEPARLGGTSDETQLRETNPFTNKSTPNPSNDTNLDEPTNDAAAVLNAHKTGPTLFPKDQPGLTITIQPPKQEPKQAG